MSNFIAGFVGCQQVLSADELRQVMLQLATASPPCYYFLRWPHQVSGIISELEEFPSPEGQMFTSKLELRWKTSRGAEMLNPVTKLYINSDKNPIWPKITNKNITS
ncbi:MAG: hypothetical protein Fur0025_43640 [Oscillatoriaceae cyanobacterium]